MSCFLCKSELDVKTSSFMVEFRDCIIIVKDVPSQVCYQCGGMPFDDEVARRLEKIVNAVRATVITEIVVVNYNEKVA